MKKLLLLTLLLLSVSAYSQTPDHAAGTYAESGRLISLTNLSGLSDCPGNNVLGKISSVKRRGTIAYVHVKADGTKKTVEVNLERLASGERAVIFHDLLKVGVTVRVGGYSCGSTETVSAFSIDRVWGADIKKTVPKGN